MRFVARFGIRSLTTASLEVHTASDSPPGGTTSPEGCATGRQLTLGAAPLCQVSVSTKSGVVPAIELAMVYTCPSPCHTHHGNACQCACLASGTADK